ncbi:uncharacterized protein LOC121870334 [Homarus americanus]|uniref:uncharacterized protein LOC121870334 n=1 Tax=Homarus americanus TaxID=6706 RepID=UPI001C488F7B|nr:uncharacterized protein LOC121870334 [Homarus americanus]
MWKNGAIHAMSVAPKKVPKLHMRALLQLYHAGAPMKRVAVDITRPMPLTAGGNRYICSAMDYFTKWPEVYVIPNQEATTVVRSDGMVEKFYWTLGQELAKYCAEGQAEWDQKLPALLMAYRSATHESTGYTPAKLMPDHELWLPVDLLTGRPPDEELPEETTSYVKNLQKMLTEVHHQVRGAVEF